MYGRIAVPGLGDGSDVDQFYVVGIGLGFDGFYDIFYGSDIHTQGLFRNVVGFGRYQSADMQHDVGTGNGGKYIIVVVEVAPYDPDIRVLFVLRHAFLVPFAGAYQ